MYLKRAAALFAALLALACAARAEAALTFPCDPELSPFFSQSEHEITWEIDLADWHRMSIDNWDDPIMVESGSLVVLDDAFVLIHIRFARDYDYAANDQHVPDEIMLPNHNVDVVDTTDPPEHLVYMYPDEDDPYSFHYAGSWKNSQYGFWFYGSYTDPQGNGCDAFKLHL